ncbi:hypothetical protein BJG93_26260 [Paraburkholderia sprentiae WSM5005]|uniref:Uncharacterized protein n=1 Tax=Paraburkholderia sprentiae WSM5005 TaxID=754502 RepID=A0A1I9YRG4_9BURK|nr:hypothetical protein [Paraburkholderia sprentiae]APA88802.1 hypothetical protein BJG93_26260 [Paraburkholderia sprentiae WSM5005]
MMLRWRNVVYVKTISTWSLLVLTLPTEISRPACGSGARVKAAVDAQSASALTLHGTLAA